MMVQSPATMALNKRKARTIELPRVHHLSGQPQLLFLLPRILGPSLCYVARTSHRHGRIPCYFLQTNTRSSPYYYRGVCQSQGILILDRLGCTLIGTRLRMLSTVISLLRPVELAVLVFFKSYRQQARTFILSDYWIADLSKTLLCHIYEGL